MKTLIIGGTSAIMAASGMRYMDALADRHPIIEVVIRKRPGSAFGSDHWALKRSVPVFYTRMPLKDVLTYADMLIAFPGGRGTRNMIKQAKEKGLIVWEV